MTAPTETGSQREPLYRPRRSRLTGPVASAVIPIVAFVLVLLIWELAIKLFKVPMYLAAAPSDILPVLWNQRAVLFSASMVTLSEVLIGFVLAVVVAVPSALALALSKLLDRALYPVIVFFQLIPKIAIAPLLLLWFGFGMSSKIVLVFVVCLFPLLVDAMTGFKELDPRLLHLTRSMGAGPIQTLLYVRFPAALPFIFSGLKVSIVFATTAAVVGELIAANEGLGYVLLRGTANLNTALAFASLVVMSILGLLLSYLVTAIEWFATPWTRHRR